MHIIIKTFATVRDVCGFQIADWDLPAGATAGDALRQLITRYPQLQTIENKLLLAVNEEYCQAEKELQERDILAIFPPVSGG